MRPVGGISPSPRPITVVEEVGVSVSLDPYLTLRGLAGYSGLSTRKLRDLLVDPHHPIPCFRVGGKILVRRSDFDRWMGAFRRNGIPDLGAIADAMLRELQGESKYESGGQARQLRVRKGRVGRGETTGAAEVQNGR